MDGRRAARRREEVWRRGDGRGWRDEEDVHRRKTMAPSGAAGERGRADGGKIRRDGGRE